MNEEERYLFDLQGYLVLRNVLRPAELAVLNSTIDGIHWEEQTGSQHVHTGMDKALAQRGNTDPDRGPVDVYSGVLLDWGESFRRLADNPRLQPYLAAILGAGYRLDHQYAILMKRGKTSSSTHGLHGGATPYEPEAYYAAFSDGRFLCPLLAVSFALTDATAETGGFCCIPGSHKSNFALPPGLQQIENPPACVQQIEVQAGDVVLFTEAVVHGCLAWKAPFERRALMFKYCPAYVQWTHRESGE